MESETDVLNRTPGPKGAEDRGIVCGLGAIVNCYLRRVEAGDVKLPVLRKAAMDAPIFVARRPLS